MSGTPVSIGDEKALNGRRPASSDNELYRLVMAICVDCRSGD